MPQRKKIEDRIRKKELEVHELEAKAREARVYIQALQDVLKMMPKGNESQADSAVATLREGSLASQAREIILRDKIPVHINDLLQAMGRGLTRENRASLTSSLAAYVRKGEIFSRPAPNRFGLIELGHATAPPTSDDEPPDGFGGDN